MSNSNSRKREGVAQTHTHTHIASPMRHLHNKGMARQTFPHTQGREKGERQKNKRNRTQGLAYIYTPTKRKAEVVPH